MTCRECNEVLFDEAGWINHRCPMAELSEADRIKHERFEEEVRILRMTARLDEDELEEDDDGERDL